MIFSSIEFLMYFLPIFILSYMLSPTKWKNMTLLAGSLIFYADGRPERLVILLLLSAFNYLVGRKLKKKGVLIAAVAVNVGVLAFAKTAGRGGELMLGISFYTFQAVSYLIDVYRKEIRAESSPLRFAVYMMMFPQLVSGPIVRYGEVAQALEQRRCDADTLQEGLRVFIGGLAAKVLLADRIGLLWHEVQVTGYESISTPMAWLGAAAYSLQLYFDFMGYSLMAVGLGAMMGFSLPQNFCYPYLSRSVREFYRRWHMTLGRWFTRYVYIPLGGSRGGWLRTVRNLAVVWLLTALWHGLTPNFLVWGGMLLLLILGERLAEYLAGRLRGRLTGSGAGQRARSREQGGAPEAENSRERSERPGREKRVRAPWYGVFYVWLVIPVSWMCFAIRDLNELRIYLGRMFGILPGVLVDRGDWIRALEGYGGLMGICLLACTPLLEWLYRRFGRTVPGMIVLALLFWLCVLRIQLAGQNPFMYSQY